MGCNCGGQNAASEYVYTSPNGTTTVYSSEVQARAAQIREGGGTFIVRPK